jgi:hypothetical protein
MIESSLQRMGEARKGVRAACAQDVRVSGTLTSGGRSG